MCSRADRRKESRSSVTERRRSRQSARHVQPVPLRAFMASVIPRLGSFASTDDNYAFSARIPTLGATAHRPKGLKVPCSAAELPARVVSLRSSDRPGVHSLVDSPAPIRSVGMVVTQDDHDKDLLNSARRAGSHQSQDLIEVGRHHGDRRVTRAVIDRQPMCCRVEHPASWKHDLVDIAAPLVRCGR